LLPFLTNIVGKNDPHSGVPAGLMDKDGKNYTLEISPCQKTVDRPYMRCISAEFCQTKKESGVFSTGTETGDFTGFFSVKLKI